MDAQIFEKRGGAGRGQGRKKLPAGEGKTGYVRVRLDAETAAALEGQPKTWLVESGLKIVLPLAKAWEQSGTDACLVAYEAISLAIQTLERRRDSGADDAFLWTADEARLHKLLNDFWDRLREEPVFWESKLPDES